MRDMPGQLITTGHQSNDSNRADDDDDAVASVSSLFNHNSLRKLSLSTDINRQVIGVFLVDERWQPTCDVCCRLGSLLLDSLNPTVEDLRRIIYKQINMLPPTFTILTKQGWPLSRHQESQTPMKSVIKENDIIMIQRYYDHPRIGIATMSGEKLGFIFGDFNWSISELRQNIIDQLTDLRQCDFRFLETNGWPVSSQQEGLPILDLIRPGQHIVIQFCGKSYLPSSAGPLAKPPKEILLSTPLSNLTSKAILNKKTKKNIKTGSSKWPSLIRKDNPLVAKPILISYVRAEAAQHALDLKCELERQGHSVYLDVHEIKTGSDWQDALNFAVSNCKVFVPLITSMYGKTQWTNREVKLADVLQKKIIPINFLDQWPPACLAIQFASTQYINWKPFESDHGKAEIELKPSDPRVWDYVYIKRVCKALAERCKNAQNKLLNHEVNCSRSTFTVHSNFPSKRYTKPNFVVISAHPKQKVLVHELKVTLESSGYEIWCSPELQECQETLPTEEFFHSSTANTPRGLNVTIERYSVFGQAYNEIANVIADSKRGATQQSDLECQRERTQLSRMISQVSDISQVSSLTPDKMERLRMFQQKVDLAGVVVIIVSEAYTKSKTSQQQVFYCEHRKHIVLVKFDQHPLPSWFFMLMGNDMIKNVNSQKFILTLKAQVQRALNPFSSETPKDATSEAKIQCLVNNMKKNIPQPESCIYVAGSSKLQSKRSENIARAIGKELAKIKNITLCTGGFFGAPDIVSHTFYEAIQNNIDKYDTFRERVVHLLPFKDPNNFSAKAHQTPDFNFEPVSFGKTYFAGDTVKERETAVARLFDTCIVIEGGPGAAHEVEEFIWNDHFVIPIISSGGAAGGQYGVPLKILEAPPCVPESDWQLLSDKEASPEDIAQAVVNIIIILKNSIVTHNNSQIEEYKSKNKMWNKSKKYKGTKEQIINKPQHILRKDEMVQTQCEINAHGHRLLQRQVASCSFSNNYKEKHRWQKFFHCFNP